MNQPHPHSDDEWQKKLTPEQYRILHQGDTEAPFSGKYYKTNERGMYECAACGNELFSSDTKFDSGSGWPSFWKPATNDGVILVNDESLGMMRTEVRCKKCNGHLGHVFDDLPAGRQAAIGQNAKHYCINSACLNLKKT